MESKNVLVIDDNPRFEQKIIPLLEQQNYTCQFVSNAEQGITKIKQQEPWAVICDIIMPGTDGLAVLDRISSFSNPPKMIMISQSDSVKSAVLAFRKGADEFLQKPVEKDQLYQKLQQFHGNTEPDTDQRDETQQTGSDSLPAGLVGTSQALKNLIEKIKKIAPSRSNVLIEGETGVGKELIAHAIHNCCFPSDRKFVPVNCGGIPRELLDSELFGHLKGAFTGASKVKKGYFEVASNGTLFLDEISEMPVDLQVKLLRAIESNMISRVGSTEQIQVNPRIIAATNQSCQKLVEHNELRKDLFYRLNVMHISVPPLRKRPEDLPMLSRYFIKKFNHKLSNSIEGVTDKAIEVMQNYHWPGNVRELRNVIERAVVLKESGSITPEDIPSITSGKAPDPTDVEDLRKATQLFEKTHIRTILRKTDGNRTEAANRLGIDVSTLYRKLDSENR